MPSVEEILGKTRTLVSDRFAVKFEQRLVTMTKENEERIKEINKLVRQAESIAANTTLSDEEKADKLAEMEATSRSLLETQCSIMVGEWDLKLKKADKNPVGLSTDALSKAGLPLEIYLDIFATIQENPLVPKAKSKP